MTTRREFIRVASRGAGALLVAPSLMAGCRSVGALGGTAVWSDPWSAMPGLLARIVAPTFPPRDFAITAYGARGDGNTDCTRAIRDAIGACAAAGGGRVVVPAGRWRTGPIHLKSRVNLHVQGGATLAFVTDPAAYLPAVITRWEGMEMMGYSPLIYAYGETDVAITGEGTLDGGAAADNWWPWKGSKDYGWTTGAPAQQRARDALMGAVEANTPVAQRAYGEGSYLRPQFIQPYRCTNVLIEGVTILRSPMWEINPVLCTNVTVRGVKIDTHGPNNDGCNPESCRDVLIEGCLFDTGDDCIAIKSGRNADGRRIAVPTENVIVRDCEMKDGHGGVTIGSEISGGVRNVFVERCRMDSPNLDRALRFKNNAMRGGVLEHIYMRDVTVGQVADAVLQIDFLYEEGANGPFPPVVRDVEMRRVTSRKSKYGLYLRSYPKAVIDDIRLIDCRFDGVSNGNVMEGVTRATAVGTTINGAAFSIAENR